MCSLPWPDHSRLRSENSPNDWKFTEDEHITNFISSDTMQHNYATFHESTTFGLFHFHFFSRPLVNLQNIRILSRISVLEKHEYTRNMQNLEMP